jgi:hypothetical protein
MLLLCQALVQLGLHFAVQEALIGSSAFAVRCFVLATAPSARDQRGCARLLILKDARSGSTWLAQLLAKHQRRTLVLHELHGPDTYSDTEFETMLRARMARCPIGYERGIFATVGVRYLSRTHRNSAVPPLAIASVAGLRAGGMPTVLFARTNLVKHAVALIRGGILQRSCGVANRRDGNRCAIGSVNISAPQLAAQLIVLAQNHRSMRAIAGLDPTTATANDGPATAANPLIVY